MALVRGKWTVARKCWLNPSSYGEWQASSRVQEVLGSIPVFSKKKLSEPLILEFVWYQRSQKKIFKDKNTHPIWLKRLNKQKHFEFLSKLSKYYNHAFCLKGCSSKD